ncbi:MAG: glycosyltransferase [Pseudomonadota bacterium]
MLVISGGRPLGHIAAGGVPVVQLPPLLVAGRDFSRPLDAAGRPADAALMTVRGDALVAALETFAPDVLVTETWPLGRRRLAAEFAAGIAAARAARPGLRLLASVRDIPEPPSKPARIAEAMAHLWAFDGVLCHGDRSLFSLEAIWPLAPDGPPLHHTGYVARPADVDAPGDPTGEVLVAVGGGDLGPRLLEMAAAASSHSRRPWRLRVGGPEAATDAAALAGRYRSTNLAVEPAAADYRERLARAAVSVSLAGYNTVTDLAPLGTPALIVPDEMGGEREQAIRAEALKGFAGVEVCGLQELSPEGLAVRVERLAEGPRRPPLPLRLDGAERSAALILEMAKQAQAGA